jgi:hypothetical protein
LTKLGFKVVGYGQDNRMFGDKATLAAVEQLGLHRLSASDWTDYIQKAIYWSFNFLSCTLSANESQAGSASFRAILFS